jgi:hypothetical protein
MVFGGCLLREEKLTPDESFLNFSQQRRALGFGSTWGPGSDLDHE